MVMGPVCAGISSCGCRAGYGRRVHRDPCRRVTALLLAVRIDRMYDTKVRTAGGKGHEKV